MIRIARNPDMKGLSELYPSIVYSVNRGVSLSLDLMIPWERNVHPEKRFPTVVFTQGSAWTFPVTGYEIPQLGRLAAEGFVVACVRHRNREEGYPAPAFLEDVKCAIRFLRAHAEEYGVDPERVYAYGTSSGGNTSLLLGLTGDMEKYKTDEYPEYSDSVAAVAECFGPTDLDGLFKSLMKEYQAAGFTRFEDIPDIKTFCGGMYDAKLMEEMSPISYVQPGKKYVPYLIIHGDADPLVPFEQSAEFVKKLEECGADVSFICVEGAEHEGTFWSLELHDMINNFFKKQAFPVK